MGQRTPLFAVVAVTAIFFAPPLDARESSCLERGGAGGGAVSGDRPLGCLSCHDGSVASSTGTESYAPGSMGDEGHAHPIDISYVESVLRNRTRLRNPAAVDRRLAMPDGKVQCVTCHDRSSTEDHMLVMSNAGSALCYGCHEM